MFWPFKRKTQPAPSGEAETASVDMYDKAAQNLIAQGVDPAKVERAARMVKKFARDGALPEGTVKPKDE